jgi:hypothetical protein
MSFKDMFGDFQLKNTELLSLADFAYEVCVTTCKEQSAGTTMGLDEHAIKRQAQYIENARARLAGIKDRPLPDLPATHPILFDRTYVEPDMITSEGSNTPLNTDAAACAKSWHIVCYELVKSNSAGLGGGMTSYDAARCEQNITAIEQFLDAIAKAADVDFPETADPAAVPKKKK